MQAPTQTHFFATRADACAAQLSATRARSNTAAPGMRRQRPENAAEPRTLARTLRTRPQGAQTYSPKCKFKCCSALPLQSARLRRQAKSQRTRASAAPREWRAPARAFFRVFGNFSRVARSENLHCLVYCFRARHSIIHARMCHALPSAPALENSSPPRALAPESGRPRERLSTRPHENRNRKRKPPKKCERFPY